MEKSIYLLCESNEQCLEWWAHDLNDEFLFENIRRKSRQKVKWRCPTCETVFEKEVFNMIGPYGPVCPTCRKKQLEEHNIEKEQWENTPVAAVPELLAAWDDDRDPSTTMVINHSPTHSYDDTVFRFRCPNGHHPRVSPYNYLKRGCPFCNSITRTNPGEGYIYDEWPELAKEWVSEGNGKNTPYNTRHNSKKTILWKCLSCGYEWLETPRNRTNSFSACCPNCGKILGSLAWKYPNLAKEWDPNNELSAWQVRRQTRFVPKWICSNNPDHKWQNNIINRINGAECPYCANASKSRTELMYFRAIKKVFPAAESGVKVSDPLFSHPWTIDILIKSEGLKVSIEYDGAYWHKSKYNQDTIKSLELLKAGFLVFRIRENGLIPLDINDSRYLELTVNPLSSKIDTVVEVIKNTIAELDI